MKPIIKLNYKKAVFKDIILKLNEIIKKINKLTHKKSVRTRVLVKKVIVKKIETKPKFQYPKCPKCNSNIAVKKRGKRKNLERGDTQRFSCANCDYKFTPKTKEYRMRVSENKLNKAFELFNKGYSYSQIAKKIKGVSRQTIGRWLEKFKIKKPKERDFEREMKSRWGGTYKRKFKLKYKPNTNYKQSKEIKENASTKR